MPILRAAVDAGLKDELVFGDPDAPRFVFWEGRLRPVPGGPADLPVFDLMSIVGKIRAGLGAMGLRPGPPAEEESVEQFVRRNLVRVTHRVRTRMRACNPLPLRRALCAADRRRAASPALCADRVRRCSSASSSPSAAACTRCARSAAPTRPPPGHAHRLTTAPQLPFPTDPLPPFPPPFPA
jgi:hypothetical protein